VALGTGALEDVVMFEDVYRGRRVFVTGHTGFKGAWLTSWLLDLGAQVTGYSLDPPTEPNLFTAIGLDRRSAFGGRLADLRADVRDAERLRTALLAAAPEMVFHLAAQPLVRRSYVEPALTLETNVMGTTNLLEAVRSAVAVGRAPRAVVVVTSDKCYENLETDHAYVEGDALGGWDVYSASKACAELVCDAYRRSFFAAPEAPSLATVRAGNVIGGGDWGEDRIVPDCVRALSAGEAVEVRNPGAVRPWQHVLEPLSGYLWLGVVLSRGGWPDAGQAASSANAWNFGPGADGRLPVAAVVERFLLSWGAGEWRPAPGAAAQPHEAGLLSLDVAKAARELGWRPVWDVEKAVDVTVEWYLRWSGAADGADLLRHVREDVAAYAGAARSLSVRWAG
jgi:CDP-glucose 4,6-dehydratase